jgi:hypothetical protein
MKTDNELTMKHTKGPWMHDDDGFIYAGSGEDYVTIADPNCTKDLDLDEMEANARLIAAAPEMIKFIHEFAQFLNAHQYEEKKILKGYTLAANLGEKATEFSTRAVNIITKATQP